MITADPTTKAIPDNLKRLFKRIVEGAGNFVPRESTPEEVARYRQSHRTPAQVTRDQQAADDAAHQARMKTQLAALKAEFDAEVERLVKRLDSGDINLVVFRALFIQAIRFDQITAASIGAGGIAFLKPEDSARIDAAVREQTQFLDNWISQLERHPEGKQSAGYMANRAKLYGHAADVTAAATLDNNRFQAFPALPFYPKQYTLCRSACACGWQWMNVDHEKGDADIFWRLDWTRVPLEHCAICLRRAEDFSPLKIRNWQFVNMPADLSPYIYR